MSEYSLGMMQSGNDVLEQLKKEIYRDDKPYRTVQTRIGDLTPEERKQLYRENRSLKRTQMPSDITNSPRCLA